MLATVGWLFPKLVGTFEGPVDTTDPIAAFAKADPQWWAQFVIFCGTIEAVKYRGEFEGKSYTGEVDKDAAVDWAKQWGKLDAAKREDMAMKELKNGRLAMIGIASFAANYFIPVSLGNFWSYGCMSLESLTLTLFVLVPRDLFLVFPKDSKCLKLEIRVVHATIYTRMNVGGGLLTCQALCPYFLGFCTKVQLFS
jgi:hypothetical protein